MFGEADTAIEPGMQASPASTSATGQEETHSVRKLRVCMVAYSFFSNDARIRQYAVALTERGDEVEFIGLRREGQPSNGEAEGVKLYHVQTRRKNERSRFDYLIRILSFFLRAFALVTRLHIKKPYDVIHVHSVPDFLVFSALVPKLSGATVILDIHDILPEFYASKFKLSHDTLLFRALLLIERLSARFADHVIVANDIWAKRIAERCGVLEKCTAVRNYPDPRIFHRKSRTGDPGKFVIAYPGSLNRHQGLDIAIRAFSRVVDQMPDAEVHIYGEGPAKNELIALATDLGLTERVLFHNYLPLTQVAEVMSNADLGVVPKRANDAFGNEAASTKIMEFMSVGTPVIVSRTTIDTFYFTDSQVMFFDSGNEEDLGKCFLMLYSDKRLRLSLSANAARHAAEHNWMLRRTAYLQLIDDLACRGHVASKSGSHV